MNIDFLNIYCLATGKPIAAISDDESGFILDTCNADALESLCLASMRPSLPWMSLTPQSIDHMREAAPRQLLAYLMNRLYAPIETDKHGKPLSRESWLAARRMRIHNWQIIESADFGDENLNTMLFMLLDLDSRFNLTKLTRPQSITSLWDSWHKAFASTFLGQLTDWRNQLVKEQMRRDKQAAYAREFWSDGNRLTRNALANQFNRVAPAKRATPEEVKYAKGIKAQKAARLAASVSFLDELERELTVTPVGASEAARVEPTVTVKPKIVRFGVKKMES